LLNLSIEVIVFAIHAGISAGILPEPPRLSAIISSEMSIFGGLSFIVHPKQLERTLKARSNTSLIILLL
jgi:hypothetical protein